MVKWLIHVCVCVWQQRGILQAQEPSKEGEKETLRRVSSTAGGVYVFLTNTLLCSHSEASRSKPPVVKKSNAILHFAGVSSDTLREPIKVSRWVHYGLSYDYEHGFISVGAFSAIRLGSVCGFCQRKD